MKKIVITGLILLILNAFAILNCGSPEGDKLANRPPSLESIPDITVYAGDTVTIEPSASDPDGNTVFFSYSGWMNSNTCTTTPEDRGVNTVMVTASDGLLENSVDVTVTVLNNPPVITSTAPTSPTRVWCLYNYQVIASDPDAPYDSLACSLPAPLSGMSITPTTCLFSWVPDKNQLEQSPIYVTIKVADGKGGEAFQDYQVEVFNDTWTILSPSGVPPEVRGLHSAIYDPPNQRMIIVGGVNGEEGDRTATQYGDVWELNLDASPTWSLLTPTPDAASGSPGTIYAAAAAYSPNDETMVIYGGDWSSTIEYEITCPNGSCNINCNMRNNFSETWGIKLADDGPGTWVGMPDTSPNERYGASIVYDPVNERSFVFGGETHQSQGNGCRCDGSDNPICSCIDYDAAYYKNVFVIKTDSWEDISPFFKPATVPSPRAYHSAVYDPVNERMLVFGGENKDGVIDNNVYSLDVSYPDSEYWTTLAPGTHSGTIPGRSGHTAIYDDENRRMIIFGGWGSSGEQLNDVWALNLFENGLDGMWVKLNPSGGAPSAISGHSAVYDSSNKRMIIFGGSEDGTCKNDVWELK
ncbi:MAG: hypothetical protein JSU92_09645 [Deltaproteobacteria bacterium]|nr:MAG: hypothetical protein JSU92_09645 [Deltaproteobacteria bacterium]